MFSLEHAYYLNISYRPAIPGSNQLLDVTSCLFLGIFCKQYTYLCTKISLKTKFYLDRPNIRNICFEPEIAECGRQGSKIAR